MGDYGRSEAEQTEARPAGCAVDSFEERTRHDVVDRVLSLRQTRVQRGNVKLCSRRKHIRITRK